MNSGVFTQSNEAEETQKKARFIIYNTGRGRYRASLLYSVIDWCAGIFKSKQTGRREKRIFTRHTISHERVNNVHKCVHGNGNILFTLWGFVCVHVQRGWLGKMESGCVGKVRLIRETESQLEGEEESNCIWCTSRKWLIIISMRRLVSSCWPGYSYNLFVFNISTF